MARRAIDAARLTEVLTGFDPADPYSVASTGAPATSAIGKPLDGLTVGVARRFFFDGLDDGVGERIETFLGWLADQGTVAADVPDFGAPDAHEHWTRIVGSEGAAYHRERLLASPDDFSPTSSAASRPAWTSAPSTSSARWCSVPSTAPGSPTCSPTST
ncbi:amidase family protein [Pseudonocardia benzenivorans]